MAEEMTKALLLEQIRIGRESLEAALRELSPDQMEQAPDAGGWSVKDVLAHIAWWEGHMAGWLQAALRGEEPAMPAPGMSWDDIDILNGQIYQEGRDQPLALVLASLADAHERALAAVAAAPDEALLDPTYFPWRNEVPLWNMVAANTYWHYEEHAGAIGGNDRA